MSQQRDYWIECVSQALDECQASLSKEQVEYLADAVQGSHENYGSAFYMPDSPGKSEADMLRKELEKERQLVLCPRCKGRNLEAWRRPEEFFRDQCFVCVGRGLISPDHYALRR